MATKPIVFVLICIPMFLFSQVEEKKIDSLLTEYIIIDGDSIPRTAIDLDEVIILPDLKFKTKQDKRRYYILRRKTIKVYPYAKLAAERLEIMNDSLKILTKRRKQKKYAKQVQKYIESEFADELKKLTRTEGQILIKLIHRQTGKTSFQLIKELRNGWRAFWFNSTASFFDISLKREFNPVDVEEDYLIEDILQRNFRSGRLKYQKSAIPFDFYDLTDKWKKPRRNTNAGSN